MGSNKKRIGRSLTCMAAAAASFAMIGAGAAWADSGAPADGAVPDWSGLYAGVNVGAAFGTFKTDTTLATGSGYFTPAFGLTHGDLARVNSIGGQKFKPVGFSGGATLGNNWQDGNFVFGIETDFDYMHMNGSSARFGAYKDTIEFLDNNYGNADWLVTLRPRLGYAVEDRLFYVTGGLALANPSENAIFTDGNGAVESAARNSLQAGYVVGAGLEWMLSDRLSMKAEYLHVGFGNSGGHQTSTNLVPPVVDPLQSFGHEFGFNANIVRLGFNYRLGDVDALFGDSPAPSATMPDWLSDWQVDVGMRVWANSGRIGAPDPLLNYYLPPALPKILASRITFTQLGSITAETFARVDHSSGFFIKGYLGGGGIDSGHQNDEDFPAEYVYSNTLSHASGALAYATVDAGYSFLTSPTARIGAFAGYNYYTAHVNTFGCTQIAQDYFCDVPSKSPGLIQQDNYHSLRLGLSSQFMPSSSLRLTTDIAYLPAVEYDGRDEHNFRQLLLPETATSGNGVMLDASLDYLLTDAWSIGVGGRYWTYNMRNGSVSFNFLGTPPPAFIEPSLYDNERYGVFLQTAYRFGAVDSKPDDAPSRTVDWTGIYGGIILGAGLSDEKWRDPYPSTTFFGYTNQAGFGDADHASGPLAGGRLAANWQVDHFVAGLEAEASWADIRGLNTCFSGLGGVGCGHIDSAVYDLAARGGYAWDQSFVYVKAGGAEVATTQSIFGNTYGYLSGTSDVTGKDHVNKTLGGWLLGAGYEFAIDDDWTGSFEYSRVGGLDSKPLFPAVTVIGATPQHVSQDLNLITVGLSYKLF